MAPRVASTNPLRERGECPLFAAAYRARADHRQGRLASVLSASGAAAPGALRNLRHPSKAEGDSSNEGGTEAGQVAPVPSASPGCMPGVKG